VAAMSEARASRAGLVTGEKDTRASTSRLRRAAYT
jgi:hypothetical protein